MPPVPFYPYRPFTALAERRDRTSIANPPFNFLCFQL